MSSDSSDRPEDKPSTKTPSPTEGSARKDRAGFWRRMVDWVAPPDEGEEGQAPQAEGEALPLSEAEELQAVRAAMEARPPKGPQTGERMAIQLVLPDGQRLLMLAKPMQRMSGGVLELEVEDAPANPAVLVQALSAAATASPKVEPPLPEPARPKVSRSGKGTEEMLPASISPTLESELLKEPFDDPPSRSEPSTPSPSEVMPDIPAADPDAMELQTQVSVSGTADSGEPDGYHEIDLPMGDTDSGSFAPLSAMATAEAPLPGLDAGGSSAGSLLPEPDAEPPKKKAKRPDRSTARTPKSSKPAPVVGIDFGTSYSSVAVYRGGEFHTIPIDGDLQMPSVISFPEPDKVLIGAEARRRMAGEAQWTISSPKRLLGRPYKDPQVSQHIGGLAFRTFAGSDKFTRFEAHGEIYSVTDLGAMILRTLKEQASEHLQTNVTKAVFAVPVGHGSIQRSALELAARQAGLEVVGLLTEPSASVISHGFHGKKKTLAVYDFGGGTFDFCVLKVQDTAYQVVCAGGDSWLGGDDFDTAMGDHLADLFWNETSVDLRTRAVEWQALLFACEEAKRKLSKRYSAAIRLDDLLFTSEGRKGLNYKMSRREFTKLIRGLVDKSITCTDKVMAQAGISPKEVEGVIMSGGTSMIPAVREAVADYFNTRPLMGDPDLAVCKGTALRAAELDGEPIETTALSGRTIREVAGRTIGAGVKGGRVLTLIERNAPLPAEAQCTFYTQYDGQTGMAIGLFEESKSRIDETRSIGQLRYKGLKKAPAGQRKIDFTFLLDEDGLLHVTATVEGKEYNKTIRLG